MSLNILDVKPETVSLQQAATMLGTSPRHAYQLHREQRFPVPTIQVGRRIMVSRRALERLLDGGPEIDPPSPGAD